MIIKQYAQRALLKAGIDRLPITSADIERYMTENGWVFYPYFKEIIDEDNLIQKAGVEDIAKRTICFAYINGEFKCIFYNTKLAEKEKVIAFAHELGHIELGHLTPNKPVEYTAGGLLDQPQEAEANAFALEFLAPDCIMQRAGIISKNSIEKYVALSDGMKNGVYANLHRHGLHTQEERQLLKQFKPFISFQRRQLIKRAAAVLIPAVIITGAAVIAAR